MDTKAVIPALDGLAVTDELKAFIRQELGRYRAFRSADDGEAPSVTQLAGEIEAADGTVEFGTETLRRFLKNEPQKTRAGTIKAIARYLIAKDWLQPKDLELYTGSDHLRAALALGEFFKVRSRKTVHDFYKSLSRSFAQITLAADRVIRTAWTITFEENRGVASLAETVSSFEVSRESALYKRLAADPSARTGISEAEFDAHREEMELVTEVRSRGFVIGDHRFLVSDVSTRRRDLGV
ncbi:hypothetical protein [Aliiruegeria lutimaris]|uniref:Uncharacterized protein n=1 Tax=Aliiruegeria lutimaris TaxID=571298 RepID=A0A1G9LET7_9RHOB|nr:hypothetical protein [Aliiruegeria lutimaris]SDL60384.1 hypothetical protein SAMN04488026_10976 [Aliiruegeria lutimaris]